MPGSRANASTRRATGSMTALTPVSAEARDVETRGDGAHLLLGKVLRRLQGLVHRRDLEVLAHVDILGIDGRRLDGKADELLLSGDRRLHDAAAGRTFNGHRLELGLDA